MAPLFLNPVSLKVVPNTIVFSQEYLDRTLVSDRSLIERIIDAYHKATSSVLYNTKGSFFNGVWTPKGYEGQQEELVTALENKDCADLHQQLNKMFISKSAHALGMGHQEYNTIVNSPENLKSYGIQWVDRLVSLGYSIGAAPVPYPEFDLDDYNNSLNIDVDNFVSLIEKQLGIELFFPNICGVFGGKLRNNPFPMHAFLLLGAAYQVSLLAPCSCPTIVEIGGGFGGLAYWVTKLLSINKYFIYDIPYVSALQAYFLGRTFDEKKIALYGEYSNSNANIFINPSFDFIKSVPRTDIAISQDSLTEISPNIAFDYLSILQQQLCGPFLSLNHEVPVGKGPVVTSIPKLIKKIGGYFLANRSPFFLRSGFVQEVYYPLKYYPRFR